MGQFLKRVYAFRKYTRIPEYSILVPGSVFVNANMDFGSILEYRNLVYYVTGHLLNVHAHLYASRKYTRIPESSILVHGSVL